MFFLLPAAMLLLLGCLAAKIVRLLCPLLLEFLKHLDRLAVMPAVEPLKALLVGNR